MYHPGQVRCLARIIAAELNAVSSRTRSRVRSLFQCHKQQIITVC